MNSSALFWVEAAGALVLGVALGFIHFGTLMQVSKDYLTGHAARAVVLHIIRLLLMVAILVGLAWAGTMPLLAGALGILLGRGIVVRHARRAP